MQLGNNSDNYILAGNTATGGFLSIRVNVSAESISSGTEALRIFSNSNVFIGNSPSDNGARLQVSGTATFSSSVTAVSLRSVDPANTFSATFGANSATPNWVAVGTIGGVPSINGYTNTFSSTTNLALQPNGGNVLIGNTSAYTSRLTVQAAAGNRPAIKAGFGVVSGNGYWVLGDNYTLDESLTSYGIDYSSGDLVLGSIVAPSTTTSGAFISTQAQFGNLGSAIRAGNSGDIYFFRGTSTSVVSIGGAKSMTESMRINSSGNVGIGSTSPNRKLEVITGNGTTNGIRLTYASGVATEGMDITYLNVGNTTTSFDSIYNSNSAVMQFRMKTAATPVTAMTILGSGNVGLNNGSPSGRLHVTSTGISASSPSLGWPVYNAENDTNARLTYIDTEGNGSVSTAGWGASVVLQLGQYYDSRVVITTIGAGGASPSDQGTGRGKDLMLKAGTSDNTNGYKGGRLYLNGGMGYQSAYNANGGDILMQSLPGSGNVIIGTSTIPTPVSGVSFPLSISSSAATRLRIDSTSGTPNSGVGLYANGVQKFSFAMYGTTSDFTIYNDALLAPSLVVKGDTSNVLIGTTTSTGAKLEVNGSIRTGTLDTGYVSGFWKLGRAVIGTQPSETHQIIVEINGALFVIGAAAL